MFAIACLATQAGANKYHERYLKSAPTLPAATTLRWNIATVVLNTSLGLDTCQGSYDGLAGRCQPEINIVPYGRSFGRLQPDTPPSFRQITKWLAYSHSRSEHLPRTIASSQ